MAEISVRFRARSVGAGKKSYYRRRSITGVLLVASAVFHCACKATTVTEGPGASAEPAGRSIQIVHRVDGSCHCTLAHASLGLHGVGSDLIVTDGVGGPLRQRLALGPLGRTAAVVDLVAAGEQVLAVLHEQAVITIGFDEHGRAVIAERIESARLGILPRRLTRVGDEMFVSGPGGIVQLSDGEVIFPHGGDPGPVALSSTGLVTTVGRRIYDIRTAEYVGSASVLHAIPGAQQLVFSREGQRRDQPAAVGLMGADLREIDLERATVAVDETVRCMTIIDSVIWIATDSEIRRMAIAGNELHELPSVPLGGVRDLAAASNGMVSAVGAFGRAVLYPQDDSWRVQKTSPAPGGLSRARFDGRVVLVGNAQATWQYRPGADVRPMATRNFVSGIVPGTVAVGHHMRATIDPDRTSVQLRTREQTWSYRLPEGVEARTVASVSGDLWIGHERGVTVVRPALTGGARVVATVRLPGAADYLWPLLRGDGAVYVSEHGGLGVLRWIELDGEVLPPDIALQGNVAQAFEQNF